MRSNRSLQPYICTCLQSCTHTNTQSFYPHLCIITLFLLHTWCRVYTVIARLPIRKLSINTNYWNGIEPLMPLYGQKEKMFLKSWLKLVKWRRWWLFDTILFNTYIHLIISIFLGYMDKSTFIQEWKANNKKKTQLGCFMHDLSYCIMQSKKYIVKVQELF